MSKKLAGFDLVMGGTEQVATFATESSVLKAVGLGIKAEPVKSALTPKGGKDLCVLGVSLCV